MTAVDLRAPLRGPTAASRTEIRPVELDDALAVAELTQANRDYLAPWEPLRDDSYFTPEGQRENLRALTEAHAHGELWAGAITVEGILAGRITLNNILRGPLQSCFVGYWVAQEHAGRGIATEAVRQALDLAFQVLALHRVEAFTRVDNHASQRVLEHNGFTAVGVARRHIHVGGRWHDEHLFELLAPWDDGITLHPPTP